MEKSLILHIEESTLKINALLKILDEKKLTKKNATKKIKSSIVENKANDFHFL